MKKNTGKGELSKLDRKTVERNRRIHMKALCFKLASLIPPHHSQTYKDRLSQQDQFDLATTYITQLKEGIDGLKKRKDQLMEIRTKCVTNDKGVIEVGAVAGPMASTRGDADIVKLPVIQLMEWVSGLEVSLISGLNKKFMLFEVISLLHEEGAEVVSASISTIGDKIFHTIHAQVRINRVGIETSRIMEKLHELAAC
ncbi:hypothetical protein SAY86_006957 [Trapa natans]|uniref:BHLH domain-containing protein n=1 Tax=Trapa natans TaxID=22666 RepID=A0AAN7L8B2_TRANT|nr:hypothetical protein SAY86_006957 [Trapa natans]